MATLNTRLKLKYDSYANWSAEANQFVLLKGEVAFCYIPDAIDAVHNPPTLMYKVGDGAKTFNQLSWGSALASDVYNWAKAQYAPVASLESTDGVVVTKTAANAHTAKASLKDYTKSTNVAKKAAANANKTYAVELDSEGHLAVVVPWTDNNTNTAHAHTAGIGLKVDGNGGVSGTTTYKAALKSETKNTAEAGTGKLYAVEADANGNLAVNVPWTDNNTTSFTISAGATDDDVVVLTGKPGTNGVSYDAKHAKKGPAATYTSGNTTTEIKGSGGSGVIKVPQITVDTYGHVTAAADESVTITLPTVSKSAVGLGSVVNAGQDATPTANSTNYVTSGGVKTYVDDKVSTAISGVTQFDIVRVESLDKLPAPGKKGTIYLVPHNHGTSDSYDEYIWNTAITTPAYEKIGNTDVNLSGYVPTSRKINNKPLSADINLTADDVGVTEDAFAGLKKTGTVTSVSAGEGLTGGPITSSGTIKHAANSIGAQEEGLYKVTTDKFGHITKVNPVAKEDITKLGIPGSDTNENQKVKVGNTSFGANAEVKLVAGSNVTITPETSNNTITISATNTVPHDGKLKDGTGIEIFSANASTDVQILVIDCGSATEVKYTV